MKDFTYYVDLNPRFPGRGERRWAVLYNGGCDRLTHVDSFTHRKYAEKCARAWNDAEYDPFADVGDALLGGEG